MSSDPTSDGRKKSLEQLIRVDRRSSIPLATQLTQQLVWLIASGQITQSQKLPSVRTLADHLGVAVQTVQAAYRQLQTAGLVQTRHGSGTVLSSTKTRNLAAATSNLVSWTFGVLVPTHSPFYAPFLRGLQEGAKQDSSLLFVCDTQEYASSTTTYLDQLVAKGVDGLIVTSFGQSDSPHWQASLTSRRGLPPLVFADSPGMEGSGVIFDFEKGAIEAARHIAEHGHRRIGAVIPPASWTNVAPILRGYRRALDECSFTADQMIVASGPDFSAQSGAESTRWLMERADPPTALLVGSDTLAIGALRDIKRRGLKVPDDVALVGFGDLEVAPLLDPPLTTIALPAEEMGRQVMAMLRGIRRGKRISPRLVTIDTRLVIRRSCGCGGTKAA